MEVMPKTHPLDFASPSCAMNKEPIIDFSSAFVRRAHGKTGGVNAVGGQWRWVAGGSAE